MLIRHLLTAAVLLATAALAPAQTALDGPTADSLAVDARALPEIIAWGPERQGYQAGLAVDSRDFQIRQEFTIQLLIRVPANTESAPPNPSRDGRLLRRLGSRSLHARFFYPELTRTMDSRILRMPFARVRYDRLGQAQFLAVQPIDGPDGLIPLDTGALLLTFHDQPPAGHQPEPLSPDAALSLSRERLTAQAIPRFACRDLPLSDLRQRLTENLSIYDPYGSSLNVVWSPMYLRDDPAVTVDLQDTHVLALLQAVAERSDHHVTVDSAGVILHRDPQAVAQLEIDRTGGPATRDAVIARARAIRLDRYTMTRRRVSSILDHVGRLAESRQADAAAAGQPVVHVRADLPDQRLNGRAQFHFIDLSLYDLVRYIALSLDCHYEVHPDGLVLVP